MFFSTFRVFECINARANVFSVPVDFQSRDALLHYCFVGCGSMTHKMYKMFEMNGERNSISIDLS